MYIAKENKLKKHKSMVYGKLDLYGQRKHSDLGPYILQDLLATLNSGQNCLLNYLDAKHVLKSVC